MQSDDPLLTAVKGTDNDFSILAGNLDLIASDNGTYSLLVGSPCSEGSNLGSRRVVNFDVAVFDFDDCCLGHVLRGWGLVYGKTTLFHALYVVKTVMTFRGGFKKKLTTG